MARAKSAVLSDADRKAVIRDLKLKVKEANTAIKTIEKAKALATKDYTKTHATLCKEHGKVAKIAEKLTSELNAITGAMGALSPPA